MSNLVRPRGKVSVKEMEKVIKRPNWYHYIRQCKQWAEDHERDLRIEQISDKDTRGNPRKYYDAQTLLDFWQEEKGGTSIPGGVKQYRRVEHRLKRFADESNK